MGLGAIIQLVKVLIKEANPYAIWMATPHTLKEFLRYTGLVTFYSMLLFVNRPNEATFWMNERLGYHIHHRKIPFEVFPFPMMLPDLVEVEEFWMWMDNVFFPIIYDETVPGALANHTAIFGTHFLCGGIRVRQVRVKEEDCPWHPPGLNVTRCYPSWSAGTEDKQPFGPTNETTGLGVWEWRKGPETSPFEYFGQLTQYPSDGYWVDLPANNREEAWGKFSYLQANDWVDIATRAVIVDCPLYNANMGTFIGLTFIFEIPQGTGVIARLQQRSIRLYRYQTSTDMRMLAVEILYLLLLAYYITMELLFVAEQARKMISPIVYFSNFWNILDWTNYGIITVVISLRILWMTQLAKTPPSLENYESIHNIVYLAKQEININAANSFITYFKLFKYVGAIPRMDQLFRTLGLAQSDLLHFAIMFGIVFSGFMAAFYMAFSLEVPQYRTIPKTIWTLLCMLLGDFDFYSMYKANRVLAPVLFIGYIMFALYCLLNMFLAILNDAYSEIKAQDALKDAPNFGAMLQSGPLAGVMQKVSNLEAFKSLGLTAAHDIEESMQNADADADGQVTVEELYKVLLQHRLQLQLVNMTDEDDMDDGTMDDKEVMDQAQKLMDTLDVGKKGYLTMEELDQVKRILEEGANAAGQLMAMCDADGDGDVEGDELLLMKSYKEMGDAVLDEITDSYEAQIRKIPTAPISVRYHITEKDMEDLDQLVSQAMKHMNKVTKHAMSSKAERLASAYFKTLNQRIEDIHGLMPLDRGGI